MSTTLRGYKNDFKIDEPITLARVFGRKREIIKGKVKVVTDYLVAVENDKTGKIETFMFSDFHSKYVKIINK